MHRKTAIDGEAYDRQLVTPVQSENADGQTERDCRILRGRHVGPAGSRHDARRVKKRLHVVTARRERHHAEIRENRIAPADAGNAEENVAEALHFSRFLQPASGIGNGDEMHGQRQRRAPAEALAKK